MMSFLSVLCCNSKLTAVMHCEVWAVRTKADDRNNFPFNVTRSLVLCSIFKHVSTDISIAFVTSIFLSLSSVCPMNSTRSYSILTYSRKQSVMWMLLFFAGLPELKRNLTVWVWRSYPSPLAPCSNSSHKLPCNKEYTLFVCFVLFPILVIQYL